MKIAFIAQPDDLIPPLQNASLAIWVHEMAGTLAQEHEVTVFSARGGGLPAREQVNGVTHMRISTRPDRLASKGLKGLDRILPGRRHLYHRLYYFQPWYAFTYIHRISRLLARRPVDLLLVVNFPQFVPILRRHNPSATIALSMHCDWLVQLPRAQLTPQLEQADLIVGCSNYIRDGIRRRFPALAARCHTLYNGASRAHFAAAGPAPQAAALRQRLAPGGGPLLLYVGRVTPEKGVHVLLEAMPAVLDAVPDARLLIVGGFYSNPPNPQSLRRSNGGNDPFEQRKTAGYQEELLDLARPFAERVRFTGMVAHQELPAYYRLADLFVHPAVWPEPFGMIITEAMLSRKAVVASRSGGIPEVLADGETGLLVPPDDPGALAAALVTLLRDPQRAEAMGQRGQRRVLERFSWNNAAAALIGAAAAQRAGNGP